MKSHILVDSNVILDIVTADSHWCEWSIDTLSELAEHHYLAINPIVYAEISIGFTEIEILEESITLFKKLPIPYEACFLAGKVFKKYRQNSGTKNQPLPDFFIGAHAVIDKLKLVTRDKKRYRHYFPSLSLISP